MKAIIGGMLGGFLAVLFLAAVEAPGPWGSVDDRNGALWNTFMRPENLSVVCAGKTLDFSAAAGVILPSATCATTITVHRVVLDPALTATERSGLTSPGDDISIYSVDDETALNVFDGGNEFAWYTGGTGLIAQFAASTESRLRFLE